MTMTDMQNLSAQLNEMDRQQRVYETAMASLNKQRSMREAEGLALMFAWDTFGEEALGDTAIGKASKVAAMFCIGFAFLTPCLLFIKYAL